jgi:hypothetical protein
MRSAAEPLGWQAKRVAVWSGCWSTMCMASGVTISVPVSS